MASPLRVLRRYEQKSISSAMQTAVTADLVRPIILVQCAFDSGNLNLWNGIGDLTVNSVNYVGAGTLLSIGAISESSELQANGITVTLSGITDPLLAKARDEDYQGRELKVLLGAMDASNGVITNPVVIFSGFMDTMVINDSSETATIQVTVENRLIEFERTRVRRYTAEDQKIDYPNDKGLEFVAEMAEKEIVWGRAVEDTSRRGHSEGQCLMQGVMVQTPEGQTPIEEIKKGQVVVGADGVNTVLEAHSYAGRMQEVINVNHGLIVMTSAHPIMTTNGWAALNVAEAKVQDKEMQISELKIGSEIVFADGETVAVSDIFKQYILCVCTASK